MTATSDLHLSQESPERDPAGSASARAEPAAAPLTGVSMVAAYRAARAAQRSELRASLQQSHLARRRAREERLGREPTPVLPTADKLIADAPPAVAQPAGTSDATAIAGSVFANLVSLAVAERESAIVIEQAAPSPAVPEPVAPEPVAPEPVALEPMAEEPSAPPIVAKDAHSPLADIAEPPLIGDLASATEEPTATASPAEEPAAEASPKEESPAEPPYDPPLAEIGFGPGMLIRLSQLGLHTTGDLAQANAGELRAALGDISRLVDVETWISNARHTAKAG